MRPSFLLETHVIIVNIDLEGIYGLWEGMFH